MSILRIVTSAAWVPRAREVSRKMLSRLAMDRDLQQKREKVVRRLRSLRSALVAYSGGVDSALLLALAREALGDRAVAFTALSPAVPPDELEGARAVARRLGARHVERKSAELEDPRYAANPVNRCYYCKTELYTLAVAEATALQLDAIVAGTNADELAGVEAGEAELEQLLRVRAEAVAALKAAGFKFVTVDLEPFRSGRLNEAAGLVPLQGGSGERVQRSGVEDLHQREPVRGSARR